MSDGNRGNALLGALVSVGLATVGGGFLWSQLNSMQKSAVGDQVYASVQLTNVSAMGILGKLLTADPSSQAKLYVDPYYSCTPGLNFSLKKLAGVSNGTNWTSVSTNQVNVTSTNPRSISPDQYDKLYGDAGIGALPQRSTNLTVDGVNYNGWLIDTINVTARTADERKDYSANSAIPLSASVPISQPPDPTCTLTATPGVVNVGDSFTLTLTISGVAFYASLNGDSSQINCQANSINSTSVITRQVTIDKFTGPTMTSNAVVYGPAATVSCSVTVSINSPSFSNCQQPTLSEGGCPRYSFYFTPQIVPTPTVDLYCLYYFVPPDNHGCWTNSDGYAPCPVYKWSPPSCSPVYVGPRGTNRGCFTPETRIMMADGSWRAIASLRQGELVANPVGGAAQAIAEIIAGPEEKRLWRVEAGGYVLNVTEGHPFLTQDGLKPARSLIPRQDRIATKRSSEEIVTKAYPLPLRRSQQVINIRLSGPDNAMGDHLLVADGIVSGDLYLQNLVSAQQQEQNQTKGE